MSSDQSMEKQIESCSAKGRKGKRLWKKVKYQLVEYHSLPGYLKDNEYILDHYRAEWPMKQVLLSIFTLHNETLNVWTYVRCPLLVIIIVTTFDLVLGLCLCFCRHLIGFFIFLCLTIYSAMKVPNVDIHSLQFPNVLNKADFHKMQAHLMACLPSLPDLQKLCEELSTSLPSSMDLIPSMPSWHVMDLLYNCLPERFSHNQTDVCVVVSYMIFLIKLNICVCLELIFTCVVAFTCSHNRTSDYHETNCLKIF